jgi:hypothetical protein
MPPAVRDGIIQTSNVGHFPPISSKSCGWYRLRARDRPARPARYHRVAIVEKLWNRNGSITVGLITMNAEAGCRPVFTARRLSLLHAVPIS